MATAVRVVDLFARPQHLDRAARELRQLGHTELQAERVGLAAECTSERRLDHADLGRRQFQHSRECAMHIVRDLRRRPDGQHAIRGNLSHGTMRLNRCVGRAVKLVLITDDTVSTLCDSIDIAKGEHDALGHIAFLASFVNRRFVPNQRFFGIEVRMQRLVHDLDEFQRGVRRVFINRRHGSHRITDEAHLVDRQRGLILGPGDDPVLDRQIRARDDGMHALQRQCLAAIDRDDLGVRMRTAQRLGVQHARQSNVVGIHGLSSRFDKAVNLLVGLAYNLESIGGAMRRLGPR